MQVVSGGQIYENNTPLQVNLYPNKLPSVKSKKLTKKKSNSINLMLKYKIK